MNPSGISAFVKDKLERRDDDRFWLSLTIALGVITCVALLIKGLHNPGAVPDDARMFLSWMGRFDNPEILKGDLIADYWSSVSPWVYDVLFRLAWLLGIDPLILVRFFPAFLFPPMAFFGYRLLRSFGVEPIITFIVIACLLHILARGEIVPSGTPRSLWPLFTLMVLDGLSRKMVWQTAIGQLLLAGCYPQMALVTSGIIGLSAFSPWQKPWIDLSRRRIAIVLVAAIATIAGILPFLMGADDFSPIMTLAEARNIPTFQIGGRGQIFSADGSVDFFCSARTGIFSDRCDGLTDPKILWLAIWYFSGPLLLFLALFNKPAEHTPRSPLPLYLVVTSLGLAGIAALMMFKLHLPNRYMAFFFLLPFVSTLPVVLSWLRARTLALVMGNWQRWSLPMTAGLLLLVAGSVFLAASVKPKFSIPENPALINAIAALPEQTVVGGFVKDLDFSPVFTNRSTLFNRELSIAYQRGYFLPIQQRMQAMRDLVLTSDPAVLSGYIRSLKLDRLAIDDDTLSNARVPVPFRSFFGPDLNALEDDAKKAGPSLVAQLAPRCTSGTYGAVHLLDTACILGQIAPN
ncbi:hypothetical protein [Phyllobacterium sp. YR531]|uniref:hypothetical protein n=1 Tax=Phyllobacterium sp. YR531 TaxID=1144343 RepID=UPI00026FAA38|nr:hypothetical protein [Phyllobacterium sp. YR531]EJN00613.1 hypothetical protein PMI41_03636 [Phyllobacterium sp. YR531]